MRPALAAYAALSAVDTALAALPEPSAWRRVTKPLLMPLLLASLRERPVQPEEAPASGTSGDAAPAPGTADEPAAVPDAAASHCLWGGPVTPRSLTWVRRAVACSCAGDIALLRPTPGALLAGMGGFWAAHACYARAFLHDGASQWLRANPYAIGVAVGAGGLVVGALARQAPGFERPVVAYGTTITAMALLGVATGRPAVRVGVILFCISDTVLGLGQFAGLRSRGTSGMVMATYTLAQGLIAHAYAQR